MKNLKYISTILLMAVLLIASPLGAQAQEESKSIDKQEVKEYKKGEKQGDMVSLWIPGILLKTASLFINKDEEPELKKALVSVRSLRILVRDGDFYSPRFERKFKRIEKRMKRRKFSKLIQVDSDGEQVSIDVKTNKKEKIKQAVVMVHSEDESFVIIKAKGKLDIQKLMQLSDKYSKESESESL